MHPSLARQTTIELQTSKLEGKGIFHTCWGFMSFVKKGPESKVNFR